MRGSPGAPIAKMSSLGCVISSGCYRSFVITVGSLVVLSLICYRVYLHRLHFHGDTIDAVPGTAPNRSHAVVPNIVHYIWFGEPKTMTSLNYLSTLSAYKKQQPDVIVFHCEHEPQGPWWEKLRTEVPLVVKHRQPPNHVHGQALRADSSHQLAVAKLEILIQYGGIYLDHDVVVLRSVNPLRHYDITLGTKASRSLDTGVILAAPRAPFLAVWYESYRNNLWQLYWDYTSDRIPLQLYKVTPDLLHVDKQLLDVSDWHERQRLPYDVTNWDALYAMHVSETPTKTIKTLLSETLGEVLRSIFYDSSSLP